MKYIAIFVGCVTGHIIADVITKLYDSKKDKM